MNIFAGLSYNLKGLKLGLTNPRLLILGIIRFILIAFLVFMAGVIVFKYYQNILTMLWLRPDSIWLVWLWYLISWIVALLLFAMGAIFAYLLGQIAFAVFIMDKMAQITEKIVTGKVIQPQDSSVLKTTVYLIQQEVPRAIFPVFLSTILMVLGWLTPLGPILTFVIPAVAIIFLAWDNTDLIPARKLVPFKERFQFLKNNLFFHFGFGLLFLIPVANILFLSFAPVGGALYYIDRERQNANLKKLSGSNRQIGKK